MKSLNAHTVQLEKPVSSANYCRSFNIQYVIGRNERDTVIQGNKIYIFRVTEDFSINV